MNILLPALLLVVSATPTLPPLWKDMASAYTKARLAPNFSTQQQILTKEIDRLAKKWNGKEISWNQVVKHIQKENDGYYAEVYTTLPDVYVPMFGEIRKPQYYKVSPDEAEAAIEVIQENEGKGKTTRIWLELKGKIYLTGDSELTGHDPDYQFHFKLKNSYSSYLYIKDQQRQLRKEK